MAHSGCHHPVGARGGVLDSSSERCQSTVNRRYCSHLHSLWPSLAAYKRMSGYILAQHHRTEMCQLVTSPLLGPRRMRAEKEACLLLKSDSFSRVSANTPLRGTSHLFCKVSIDPTHREMTPLYSRRACQSARPLFSYNMFHIFIANTTSGVLVSSCIKLMLHFHERLNMKRRK